MFLFPPYLSYKRDTADDKNILLIKEDVPLQKLNKTKTRKKTTLMPNKSTRHKVS